MKEESCSFKLKSHPDKKLKDHLKEVLEHTEDLTDRISFFDDRNELKETAELIAASHDFGKSSEFFQDYLNDELDRNKKFASHGLISALFCLYLIENRDYENQKKDFIKLLAYNVIKHHHGNLNNLEKKVRPEENKHILEILESIKKNKKEVKQIYRELLGLEISLEDFQDFLTEKVFARDRYYPIINPLQFGNITKDRNRYFFIFQLMYSILLESDKKSASGAKGAEVDFKPEESYVEDFKSRFDSEDEFNQVRESIYQETISNLKENWDKKRFFEIDAPTGSGKTLTMLGAAFELHKKMRNEGKNPQIIYSLPFISIIRQNYDVFKKVLKNYLGKIDNHILMEHHHLADGIYSTGDTELEYSKSNFLINNWYSEIIVTTFYQLFKSVYSNKNHRIQKTNKLSDSIILIDEIQSIPPDLILPIRDFLKFLSEELNSYVILGTATQPKLNKKNESQEDKIDINKLFPIKESDISEKTVDRFFNRYRLNLKHFKEKTVSELSQVLEESKNLNNFMVVLNTINSTKELYRLLKEKEEFDEFELIYLSTNIPPKERNKRINKAQEKIKNKEKFILITTQLIEAGVDISLERIYRDKAPLDKIVQTAGRTNRNNEKDISEVYLLNLVNEEHNYTPLSSYIYDKTILQITQKLLNERDEIEEKEVYSDLIPRYFGEVLECVAQGISRDKSGNIRKLQQEISKMEFEKVEKDFRLINNDLPEITCFVMDGKEDRELWKKYVEISEMPSKTLEEYLEKKESFSKIREEFNKRTITIKIRSEDKKEDIREHIHRLSNHNIKIECNKILCIDSDNEELYDKKLGAEVKDIEAAMVL